MRECENCGETIGRLETPYTYNQYVVCKACYDKLTHTPVPEQQAGRPSQDEIIRTQDHIFDLMQAMGADKRIHVLPAIPPKQLNNVLNTYVFGVPADQIMAIVDITFRKSAKDGATLTTRGLYTKMSFEKPKFIGYEDIHEAFLKETFTNDQLWINGEKYFTLELLDRESTHAFTATLTALCSAVHSGHWQG